MNRRYTKIFSLLFACSGFFTNVSGQDGSWVGDLPRQPAQPATFQDHVSFDSRYDAAWTEGCCAANCCKKDCSPKTTISLDYLFLWTEGTRLPALVTTSPDGTAQNQAGVLGQAGTRTLYGDGDFLDQLRSGGRFQMTRELESLEGWSIDGTYFGAGVSGDDNFFASSDGDPILARPFFDTQANAEAAQLIEFEDPANTPFVAGSVRTILDSQLHSASLALRKNRRRGCGRYLDILAGYRFFKYGEGIRVEESLESTNPVGLIQVGTTLDLYDDLDVRNEFHGGEFGFVGFHTLGDKLSVEGTFKLALGQIRKTANIDGRTVVETPVGGISDRAGGLLAGASELGRYSQRDFAALTDIAVKLRYDIRKNLSLSVGYNLFVLSDAIRLGDVVDRNVDPRELTTFDQNSQVLAASTPSLNGGSFWGQSLSLGVTLMR